MKKIALFLLPALLLLGLPACNDDDGDYPGRTLITTVRTVKGSTDYYFQRDNGETLYPGDKSRIPVYRPEEPQRAIIWFNLLPEAAAGYDYNIALYAIQEIFTGKSEVVADPARLDELGDSPTSITPAYCNLSKEWFTLYVGYPVTDNSRHAFTLIVNDTEQPAESYEGYLDVELRHSAGGDTHGYTHGFYISFDLTGIAARLEGKKGVTLKIKTQQNGTKYLQFDLPAAE